MLLLLSLLILQFPLLLQANDLTLDQAVELLRVVTECSQELKIPFVVAIMDRSPKYQASHLALCPEDTVPSPPPLPRHANLVIHIRMKGALLGSVDLALQKARGSALFPFPTNRLGVGA